MKNEDNAYHSIPKIFGINCECANIFAKNWKRFVGEGELVYVRSESGNKLIIEEKKKRRVGIKNNAFEFLV